MAQKTKQVREYANDDEGKVAISKRRSKRRSKQGSERGSRDSGDEGATGSNCAWMIDRAREGRGSGEWPWPRDGREGRLWGIFVRSVLRSAGVLCASEDVFVFAPSFMARQNEEWEMIAPLAGRGIISLSLRPGVQSLHYYRDRPTFDLFKDHHNEAPHLATPCIMVFSTSMAGS